jgi:hypothetical protein
MELRGCLDAITSLNKISAKLVGQLHELAKVVYKFSGNSPDVPSDIAEAIVAALLRFVCDKFPGRPTRRDHTKTVCEVVRDGVIVVIQRLCKTVPELGITTHLLCFSHFSSCVGCTGTVRALHTLCILSKEMQEAALESSVYSHIIEMFGEYYANTMPVSQPYWLLGRRKVSGLRPEPTMPYTLYSSQSRTKQSTADMSNTMSTWIHLETLRRTEKGELLRSRKEAERSQPSEAEEGKSSGTKGLRQETGTAPTALRDVRRKNKRRGSVTGDLADSHLANQSSPMTTLNAANMSTNMGLRPVVPRLNMNQLLGNKGLGPPVLQTRSSRRADLSRSNVDSSSSQVSSSMSMQNPLSQSHIQQRGGKGWD